MRTKKKAKKHLNSHAREIALQGLYQINIGQKSLQEEIMRLDWIQELPPQSVQDYARVLLKGVCQNHQRAELLIKKHSHKDLSQISTVVNAILHMGIYELSFKRSEELSSAIIIDDLLELTRKYDGEESVAFVNGILDAYRQEKESSF